MEIKIKLDKDTVPKEFNPELNKWEGEGGQPVDENFELHSLEAPLKNGQVFEVVKGEIIEENGEKLYKAYIKPLDSEPQR